MLQWKRGLLVLALMAMLLTASASAEGVLYDAENDTLTVTCSVCQAGNEYALLLVASGANLSGLNEDDLVFIDQLTANGAGAVEAVFVHPSFSACDVFLGGAFADGVASPRKLGSYSPSEVEEHLFSAPAMLQVIEDEAFMGSLFTHVYLSESVTSIGLRAFADCTQLCYIYIPEATVYIADDAFSGCGAITIGGHPNSAAHRYAVEKGYAWRPAGN